MNKQFQLKAAYTLVEIIIAMTIFVMMVAVVMETMVSMRSYVAADESRYSLDMEARRVMREVMQDLSTSAWYLPMEPDEKFDLLQPTLDRGLRYYPYIIVQTNTGTGDLFDHFSRPANEVVADTDFPRQWSVPPEHLLPSQELVFVKIGRNTPVDNPNNAKIPKINFDNTPTVAFDQFWTGDIVPNMKITLEGDTLIDVGLFFETNENNEMREYSYIVRPNQQTGDRELVKVYAHRVDNGQTTTTAAVQDMKLLSRYVDRVVFKTSRTHPQMDVDQIGVDIYFSRRNEAGNVNFLKKSMTVAMRSTVDPEYSENIDAWLGQKGNYPVE